MTQFRLLAAIAAVGVIAALVAAVGAADQQVGIDCHYPLPLNQFRMHQDLSYCNLKGVTIEATLAYQIGFSNLTGANLTGATIQGGYRTLGQSNLSGANLNGAILGGGSNETGVLGEDNLTGANLHGAIISGVRPLVGVNLTDANLAGASVSGFEPLFGTVIYSNTTCPDGSNSDNDGGTCVGHGVPG
jgi:uncharacterized protein YjbI with pentapeptide repeats